MGYNPKYTVTAHLLRLLESIAFLRAKIETSPVSVAWIPRLTKDAFTRIAHSSTAIEGNPLTLKEVRILADGGELPQARPQYVREIMNYLAALRHVSRHADKKNISKADVLKLHKLTGKDVLQRKPLGSYRDYQVYVGGHVPPGPQEVPRLMDDLLEWLNGKGQSLPAVFTAAILHYQFEFIHPFGDGNGRVGRLLATWEMYRRKFDTHYIFAVDEVFWENRQRYYAALSNVQRHNGDLTGWMEFVFEAVELTLENAWGRIESIRSPHEGETIELIPNQERLLRLLRESPLSIREIMEELKVTKSGAHFLLRPLMENNLVKRVGGHKTGRYTLA